jgi:Ran GTPase-activating protein (RanGAP) involved in mRNA processing and transport
LSAAALKHNQYVQGLIIKDVVRKEAIQKFAVAMKFSTTIQRLTLSGLEAEDGFVELGEALAANRRNVVAELDLSYNTIKDKGMLALSEAINSLRRLTKLNLSHCNITSLGIITLMKAFDLNPRVACQITELNLSGNSIGTYGSSSIANWIGSTKKLENSDSSRFNLRVLNLASSQLDLWTFFKAFTNTSINDSLRVLNVSGNPLTKTAIASVVSFLEQTEAVELDFSSCELSPKFIAQIITAISDNRQLMGVSLQLASNDIGTGAAVVAQALTSSKNIYSINLRNNNLRKEGLTQILLALSENPTICSIDVSDNKAGKNAELVNQIADVIQTHPSLQTIHFAGLSLGKDLTPIFQALSNNKMVQQKKISSFCFFIDFSSFSFFFLHSLDRNRLRIWIFRRTKLETRQQLHWLKQSARIRHSLRFVSTEITSIWKGGKPLRTR